MKKKLIDQIDLAGKRVFIRVDFNVPLAASGISDDTRIRAALPTLRAALDRGARVICASHLGRPKGKRDPAFSLAPVAERLEELLGHPVLALGDCIGPQVEAAVADLAGGQIAMLENLRFYAGEEKNDPEFAAALARLCDVYVGDAFGAAHRAHASIVGVPERAPESAAGYLMSREIEALDRLVSEPARPFVAVLGGAKVKGKVGLIRNMLQLADTVLLGGGLAYTFQKARGREIGLSLFDPDYVEQARELLAAPEAAGGRLRIPDDIVVTDKPRPGADFSVVPATGIPAHLEGCDIGPETRRSYRDVIVRAATVFWNGPVGIFEIPGCDQGTMAVARAVADCGGYTVVGGGDSVAALAKSGLSEKIDHISTGGGASLEYVEGIELPGVAILPDA